MKSSKNAQRCTTGTAACFAAMPAAIAQRAVALLLACALCLSLAPSLAWADEGGATTGVSQSAGSATLTIVKGVSDYAGPTALLNKTYNFADGATLEDLFAAAKAAGDIQDYAFGADTGYGSFLESVTLTDGTVLVNTADYASYWSSYKNGAYASGTDAQASDRLVNGDAFQFAWTDLVPNVAPSADQWAELKANATAGTGVAEGNRDVLPSPSSQKVEAAELAASQQSVYRTLFANLAASCDGAGAASERNVSSWKAMEAAAIGRGATADVAGAAAEAASSYANPDGFNVQRSIIVLTALGIDATQVPSGNDALNLVEWVAGSADAVSAYPTSAAFTLLAYASGSYEVAASASNSARALIDRLTASQDDATGAWLALGQPDVDTTAMVIPALAAYQGDATAKTSLDAAVKALLALQQDDGSFGNINSTAMAIVALCAVGIDPAVATERCTVSPLSALLSQAKADLSGFEAGAGLASDMVDEQGFRALVAYQGLKNTGAAYNIYTQASLGQAALPADEQDCAPTSSDKNVLAKTGDTAAPFAAGASAAMLAALAAGVVAVRRVRETHTASLRR